MSDVPVWHCDFFQDAGGPALDSLTVGSKFGMKCHGDIAVQWDQSPLQLTFPKDEMQYTLAILKTVRQDPNDVQFVVTAYKPGNHNPDYIRVLQDKGVPGEHGFEADKPAWAVKSVLDPQKPPQPYGPYGPWSLHLPLWFVISIIIAIVLVIWMVARRIRKYIQRKRMLEDLKRHTTALQPLHQFYRDARQIRRRLHNVKQEAELKEISSELNRDFRLFVLRKFQIPTLNWSDGEILRDLRRRHRKTYKTAADPLRKTLRELGKLTSREKVNSADIEQLHRMSIDTAEKLDAKEGGRP